MLAPTPAPLAVARLAPRPLPALSDHFHHHQPLASSSSSNNSINRTALLPLHCPCDAAWSLGARGAAGRPAVAAAAGGRGKRDRMLDVERDVLPDGNPNTPWRRLKLRIQTTISVQGLATVYSRNRHKTAVWRPIHSAGILMRLAALHYYRLLAQDVAAGPSTSAAIWQLLSLMAPDLADPAVTRVMDGARLAQLVVVLSVLQPVQQPAQLQQQQVLQLLDPLIRELSRKGGMKLPKSAPDLLAELAAALARLDWREQQLWMAVAATATATLQAQALRQQQQEQHQHLTQQQAAAPGAAFSAGQQQRQPQLQQQPRQQQQAPSFATGLVGSSAVADSEEDEDGSYLLEDFEADLLLLGSSDEADTWEPEAAVAAAGDGEAGLGAADEQAYLRQLQWQQQGEDEDEEGEWPGPPVFDDDEAAGRHPSAAAAAAYGQAALALPPAQPQQQHQHTQQHQQQQPTWLAADFPKLAGALAAVGHADSGVMQLLGSQAVPLLPLMPLAELAQLADAFASLGLPHPELVAALAQQLFAAASRAGSSRGFANGGHGHAADTAALVRAMAALQQLGWAADAADARGMQQQQRLLQLLQARVVQLGGATSSPQSSSSRPSVSGAPAAPGQAVSVLQLLLAAACWDAAWRHSPLLLWACGAIAGAGLDALSPPQLQAAALALAELQLPSTADAQQASKQQQAQAATAGAMQMVAAAAAARAHECSAGVLASALWGAATLGVVAELLADVAAEAVLTTTRTRGQAGGLSAGQHAQLVWALQQMGRQDLAQAVLLRASFV